MLLKGRNGNEVELAFVRESLPELQDAHGDEAWYTVVIRAATADQTWEESSPCVNLFEFQTLAEWLEALGRGAEGEESEVELLGPELKFSVAQKSASGVGIRVGFHLEGRPEEFGVDAPTDEAEYVDVFVDRENIRAAAASLRGALALFEAETKDDLTGERDPGVLGQPDGNLNMVDREEKRPPGVGKGEDNAGRR